MPRQCREDGAEDVTDKERPNFCDWFVPSEQAFDAAKKVEADTAKEALDALFGDGEVATRDAELSDAEKLFK